MINASFWIYNQNIFAGRGQGKRFKKKHDPKNILSKDDVEFLRRNTRYNDAEIEEWFR